MKEKQSLKKLSALMLALVLVLGVAVPNVAKAEESKVIDVVEVNNVQEAVVGEVATEDITVPEGANYELDRGMCGWYDWTAEDDEPSWLRDREGDVLFEDGHKYQMNLFIQPKEGYVFTEDVLLYVNGELVDDYYVDVEQQYIVSSKEYSFLQQVDKIEISNVPTAKVGEKATIQGVAIPENANYEIAYVGWYNETTGHDLQEGEVFENGYKYSFSVAIEVKSGYEFSEDAVFFVDGKEQYEESYIYSDFAEIYVEYSFLEQIDKIEILEELPNAKAGEKATAGELEVPEGANYTVQYAWMTGNLDAGMQPMVDEEFVNGNVYVLAVMVVQDEGYEFAEDATATVMGKAVDTKFVTNNGDNYIIMETHDLGENTIDKIEILATEPKAGEAISVDSVKVPENANYEIEDAVWYYADSEREATGTFQEGKQYRLIVVAVPKDGVYFANDVEITLNGKQYEGAKFENGMAVMPFLAVCELGFDLTPKAEAPENNPVQGGQNNNPQAGGQNNNSQAGGQTGITPAPATGDFSNPWVWSVLVIIAVFASLGVLVYNKKKSK